MERDTEKEAIQQIAEEIDTHGAQAGEEIVDEASHVDDYTVPEEDFLEEIDEEEEQDVFAVLDVGLTDVEEEPEEMLRTELERECSIDDEK
ncbi:MAG: hypothetical protein VB081_07900 [Christensenella sp.]|uniref:hypothetical protein n=1 Tax=Christensenella sp. TaxID=1935934 RepID=UPI002B1EB49D|nr:hypothetical protein [Christensenella sp.]MEA5003407.1 hypothetical protein [Christensenella sp.]